MTVPATRTIQPWRARRGRAVVLTSVLVCVLSALHAPDALGVVNGTRLTTSTEHPWFTTLLVKFKKRTSADPEVVGCGGAVIASQYVVTAAHCLHHSISSDSHGDGDVAGPAAMSTTDASVDLYVGSVKVNYSSWSGYSQTGGVKRRAISWAFPERPAYDITSFTGDIAVVKLDTPVTVPPLTLGTGAANLALGTSLTAVGRGGTLPADPYAYSATLVNRGPQDARTDMLVVGPGTGTQTTTHGDSGGPIFLSTATGGKVLGAVVSAGSGDGQSTYAGYGTRVDAYRDFIDGQTQYTSKWQALAPAIPTGGRVTASTPSSLTLSWRAADGAEFYEVREGATVRGTPSATTVTVTGLASSSRHTFTITAVDRYGTRSVPSAAITGSTAAPLPNPPAGLRVTAATPTSISLAWSAVPGATSYRVVEGSTVVTTTTSTTATVSGLGSGTTHTYQVQAVGSSGLSGLSASVTGSTQLWAYTVTAQTATDSAGVPADLAHARPGQVLQVSLTVVNSGNQVWTQSTLVLGTDEPRDHAGVLDSGSWLSPSRPGRLSETSVPPGGTGHVTFPVKAPEATGPSAGSTVRESYRLVAEGVTWLSGPTITVTVSTVPVAGIAVRPASGQQQWVVAADGGVFAYAGAPFYGSMGGRPLSTPVVGIAATGTGGGYWLVARDGGVFAFGDAPFAGSMAGQTLSAPVVGIAGTPSGRGYWLASADGGVFAFGDAPFAGSMVGRGLSAGVVGVASTASGRGYWLVGADGGVFAFGDAPFAGSMAGRGLSAPIVGIAGTGDGRGYWLVGADGGVFAFGTASFAGSLAGAGGSRPVVGIASAPGGYSLVDRAGSSRFFTNGAPVNRTTLYPGETLQPEEALTSGNGRYRLVMQGDGNLVEYDGGTPVWASNTSAGPSTFEAQADGNYVVYGPGHRPVWASGTSGTGTRLILQDDRNVVIYRGGTPIWANNRSV